MRIGQRHDLSRIGRIGKNFLVTGQRGIENNFASGIAFGADRLAVEDGSIFQSQNRGYRHAGTPLEPSPARIKIVGWSLSARGAYMHKAGGVLANILPPCVGLTRFGLGGNFTNPPKVCP